jgi:putative nucleotidyltransferase with HDIG domain
MKVMTGQTELISQLLQAEGAEEALAFFREFTGARATLLGQITTRRGVEVRASLGAEFLPFFPLQGRILALLRERDPWVVDLAGHPGQIPAFDGFEPRFMLGLSVLGANGTPLAVLLGFFEHWPDWHPVAVGLEVLAAKLAHLLDAEAAEMRLAAINHIDRAFETALNGAEVGRIAVELALEHTKATSAHLALLDDSADLVIVRAAGHLAKLYEGNRIQPGQGYSWLALGGQSVYIRELWEDSSRAPASLLQVPLADSSGVALGVLTASTSLKGGEIPPQDSYVMSNIAQTAGITMARLKAVETARTEAARFARLAHVSGLLERIDDFGELFRSAVGNLLELSGFEVALYLEREDEGKLRLRSDLLQVTDPAPAKLPELLAGIAKLGLGIGRGLSGQAFEQGWPVYSADYRQHPLALEELRRLGLRGVAIAPVRAHEVVEALLVIVSFQERSRPDPLSLLSFVAERLENALERSEHLQAIMRTRLEALRTLALALEIRDLETKGHSDRVTSLSLRIGREIGLNQSEIELLRQGAYLHDIGKIAVPDAVLLKPGKLSPAELEIMKGHTIWGEEMLARLGFLPPKVLEVVRHHHEKWDGSGYPDGLDFESIPLLARIFSLADVYDALTSARPYKEAWSVEQAYTEIADQTRRQFDPELVRAFFSALKV